MTDRKQHTDRGLTDKKQHPRVKRRQEYKPVPNTPEEQAKALAEQQKAAEEAKAERERIELYGKSVKTMSHRQLRGELHRAIRREYTGKPPQPQAGLNILLSTVFLAVLDNTKTANAVRPNQINPNGKLHAYPV